MVSKDIEALLPRLLSFPPHPAPPLPVSDTEYDKQIKSIVKLLSETSPSQLTGGIVNGEDLLDVLDPSINTLVYLCSLRAHIGLSTSKQAVGQQSKSLAPNGPLWVKAVKFLNRFDPLQARYAGNEFVLLIEDMAKSAQSSNQPKAAIKPIRTAILRLDPSGSCFTSSHLVFLRLCLHARAFLAAKPVLDNNIYEFPSPGKKQSAFLCAQHESSSAFITTEPGLSRKVEYQDALRYFLYGAMLYIGMKDWERALLFLEITLIWPISNNCSMIQVIAYRRWVLVNLIQNGRVPSDLPKTTNPHTARQCRILSRAYDGLADIFKEGLDSELTAKRLNAEIHAGTEVWRLVNKVPITLSGLRSINDKIKGFYHKPGHPDPGCFSAFLNNETAVNLYSSSTLYALGHLHATLSQPNENPRSWILRFATSSVSGPQARSEEQMYNELQQEMARITKLRQHIRSSNRKLTLSKDYIEVLKNAMNTGTAEGGGNEFPTGYEAVDEMDEDLIQDL
ncbi:MAG: hypothetical protein LQ351_000688 [Letrouitia transgressa]|nr:MAG: hypothetical protein LQ351_000688 [Letrouitia transgressa]